MSSAGDKAITEFLSEAQEIVDGFNSNLLVLDEETRAGRDSDPDLINDCFRGVHSLKGLTGLFGIPNTADLAHRLENLLDALRLGRLPIGPGSLDLLFEAVELFHKALAAIAHEGDLAKDDVTAYFKKVEAFITADSASDGQDDGFGGYQIDASILSVLTEYEEHRLKENVRKGAQLHRLHGNFDLMEIDTGIEEIKNRIKPGGEIVTYLPSGDSSDPDILVLDIILASNLNKDELGKTLSSLGHELHAIPRSQDPDASLIEKVEPATAAAPMTETSTDIAPRGGGDDDGLASLRSVSRAVRVDIRKLDALMNAVGELGLVHSGLNSLLENLQEDGRVEQARALRHEVRSLERKLRELQDGILEVRMVPLRQIFDKLSRVVRKVSRRIGKQIRLEIRGADTELDKLIVEELSDPLMHIIRNAIDHGIESDADRAAAGKREIGTIAVEAVQQGNRVIVSVSDDGKGIDEHAVGQAALRKGLIEESALAEMSRRELLNLLFLPGMSTREEATELSGRGVGLDVVKTNIANLSGIIDVTSKQSVGTTITITLPVTLAMIQAIIVRVAGHTYALPLNSVIESLMIEHDDIRTIEGREVITVRWQTLRLARIEEIFGLERVQLPRLADDAIASSQSYVVVVGIAQHRIGLVVDELITQQDIVIKSLGRALNDLPGVAGATELGGQKPVLVLDVPALVEETVTRAQAGFQPEAM